MQPLYLHWDEYNLVHLINININISFAVSLSLFSFQPMSLLFPELPSPPGRSNQVTELKFIPGYRLNMDIIFDIPKKPMSFVLSFSDIKKPVTKF